jgi:hypothetical protein
MYCGGMLSRKTKVSSPRGNAAAEAINVPSTHSLIIVDFATATTETVARILNLALADVSLRMRRHGYQLFRILPIHEGERLVVELRLQGLSAWSIPTKRIEASRQPMIVRGGDIAMGRLELADESAVVEIRREELLLAIYGRIHRERQALPGSTPFRSRAASTSLVLEEEHRIHLHIRREARPLEIDPGAFEFADATTATASSLLRIRSDLSKLAGNLSIDDRFRFEPPALAPAQPTLQGIFGVVEVFKNRPSMRSRHEASLLHNLEQFRFYSAWRAALTRILIGD